MNLGLGLGLGFSAGTPGNPFPTIANLKLRLESDLGVTTSSGNVTQWEDQAQPIAPFVGSGSLGAHPPALIANQVNGHPAVRFDGVAKTMESDSLLSDLLTGAHPSTFKVIAVLKNNSAIAHAGQSYNEPAVICDAASFWSPMSGDSTRIDSGFYQGPDHEVSIVQATGALVYAEATLTTAAGGTLSLQIGTAGTPTSTTGVGTIGGVAGFLKLGRNNDNTVFWAGDLFALFVATSMTTGEIADLKTYINNKWGPGL